MILKSSRIIIFGNATAKTNIYTKKNSYDVFWENIMKISKYTRVFEYENDCVLYNTVDHAIIRLPGEIVQKNEIVDNLDADSITALRNMGYLAETDNIIKQNLQSYLINEKKLFISIELNLSCNLRCPYCYQAGEHNGKSINTEDLDWLVEYINKVYLKTSFTDLYVKILGGEPTIVWDKFEYIQKKCAQICKQNNIVFHLLVDTNGTLIKDLLALEEYDSLLFTIPLTYQMCHDKVRFDAKGKGTYRQIIENINTIKKEKTDVKIVLRYNVDQENIGYFKDFLIDINQKLSFKPLVSVNYTAELNGSDEYANPLSYREFVKWISSEAIDELVEVGMPVTISPIVSIEECQFRSKYSLKLFSDGTVGNCAMAFFEKNRFSIESLVKEFDDNNPFFIQKSEKTMMAESKCLNCDSIFLCGGTNELPCIRALDKTLCNDKFFGIDLKEFLLRYLKYQEQGLEDLFVVFNNGESYR